eukprot:6000861-Pleurochrysis_carterae.AAC.1
MSDGDEFQVLQAQAQTGPSAARTVPVSKAHAPITSDAALHEPVTLTPVKNSSTVHTGNEPSGGSHPPSAQAIDSALAGHSPMPASISNLLESS